MLEENHVAPGVRRSFGVETGYEVVEERLLAHVADQENLVGAVVGLVGGGRADLGGEGTAEEGAEFVGDLGGLGVRDGVGLDRLRGGGRAIEGGDELLDALKVGDRFDDQHGVRLFKDGGGCADRRAENLRNLGNELARAEKIQGKKLGGDPTAGSHAERGTLDKLGRLRANEVERGDLDEALTERTEPDALHVQQRLEGAQGLRFWQRFIQRESDAGFGQGLGAKENLARPALIEVEDLLSGFVAQDDRADLFLGNRQQSGGGEGATRRRGVLGTDLGRGECGERGKEDEGGAGWAEHRGQ